MDYLAIKSLHVIFIVTWFAGLFYIPRLMIYFREAKEKDEPAKTILSDQLRLMTRRLWYIITWPSAVLTLIFGFGLIYEQPGWLQMPFMHIKLALVFILYGYHFSLQYLFSQMKMEAMRFSSTQLRIWNEIPTIVLISIVFLIIKKDQLSWIWGTAGILGTAITLMLAIRIYKIYREKK